MIPPNSTTSGRAPLNGRFKGFRLSHPNSILEQSKVPVDSDSNWLITMSDVMCLLLVFFVMFFVLVRNSDKEAQANRTMDSEHPAAAPQAKSPGYTDTPVEKVTDEMTSVIKDLDVQDEVFVRSVNKEVIITMKEGITFSPAEADILSTSAPVLDVIARTIKKNPAFVVEIDGHTDNVPIKTARYPSNWELSVARASSVLKYFINNHNIDPSRFYIKGNADQRPVSPNDTPEDRAQNRRVEIRLKEMGSSSQTSMNRT